MKRRPQPPRKLRELLAWTSRVGPEIAFQRLSKKRISVERLAKQCTGYPSLEG